LYVFWSLVLGFLPPVILAIMLNETVHFKGFFKFSIYFPALVPTIAVALIWYFIYQPGEGGLLNMLLGKFGIPPNTWLQNSKQTIPLIVASMTWKGFGATTVMYYAALQGVNQELYEAAKIDGAGTLRRIWNIAISQIYPIMMLFLVKQVIGIFQVMIEPMTMTGGGPNNASMSLALQGYNYAFQYFQPQKALALGVVTFLFLLVLTVLYFKVDKKLESN
ncbi:MAG: sugar ABC transporter permease, partial [Oscillospiraceae bacterium]